MSLDLPREIERMAERRATEIGVDSAAAYIARLVAADAADTANPGLEGALLEGLVDGGDAEWDLRSMRAECRAVLATTRDAG